MKEQMTDPRAEQNKQITLLDGLITGVQVGFTCVWLSHSRPITYV